MRPDTDCSAKARASVGWRKHARPDGKRRVNKSVRRRVSLWLRQGDCERPNQ